jgi:general secretion pathway protein D
MDFTDVDLPVLVKFISEQTKKNFIFDEKLQGKITIISPEDQRRGSSQRLPVGPPGEGVHHGGAGKHPEDRSSPEAKQESLSTATEAEYAAASEFITRLIRCNTWTRLRSSR